MDKSSLEEICRQGVLAAAQQAGWAMEAEVIAALAQAIHPFLEKSEQTVNDAKVIAENYYLDGPMVEEMLTFGSNDGEKLWEAWREHMLRLALAQQLSRDQAEDLVQEVYLRTASALKNFRFASRLKTYFHSIFINCYRRWVRDVKSIERREAALPTEDEQAEDEKGKGVALPDPRPSPEVSTTQTLQNAQIRHFVEQEIHKILDSDTYKILFLYYCEQTFIDPKTGKQKKWTDQAIGQQLGISPNTITSKRRRALERLSTHEPMYEMFVELVGIEQVNEDVL